MNSLIKDKKELEELALSTKKFILNLDSNISASINERIKLSVAKSYQADLEKLLSQTELLEKKTNVFRQNVNKNLHNLPEETNKSYKSFISKLEKIISQIRDQQIKTEIKFQKIQQNCKNTDDSLEDNLDDSESDLMIPKHEIVNLEHLIKQKNEQMSDIFKKTQLVSQFAKEVNTLTVNQEEEIKGIEDNIVTVKDNAKKTVDKLYRARRRDKRFQFNNCYLILFLTLILLCLILYSMKNGL